MQKRNTIRRDLLVSFAVLFAAAVIIATLGLLAARPVLSGPGATFAYIVILLVADLAVLFLFGRYLLGRTVLGPIDEVVQGTERIADGEYEHRLDDAETREFQRLVSSVNAMADRLIRDQRALAENIRSLNETNRKLTEARDELVRAEKMASVGRLAAGVAHEVGNPLGAVLNFVEVARQRAESEDRPTELFEAIEREARRIDGIVRSLLDYARPKDAVPRPVDVREVLTDARDLLRRQGRLDGIEVEVELDEEVPEVEADPHQLEQVLVNLLLNAVDAVEGVEEPRIVLHASLHDRWPGRVPVRRADDPPDADYSHVRRYHHRAEFPKTGPIDPEAPVVKIVVADNGQGIPGELIDRLFDPFVTTKDPGLGTGLGLAVSARIVDSLGGTIRARSPGEGGASFTVLLPARRTDGAGVDGDAEDAGGAEEPGGPAEGAGGDDAGRRGAEVPT